MTTTKKFSYTPPTIDPAKIYGPNYQDSINNIYSFTVTAFRPPVRDEQIVRPDFAVSTSLVDYRVDEPRFIVEPKQEKVFVSRTVIVTEDFRKYAEELAMQHPNQYSIEDVPAKKTFLRSMMKDGYKWEIVDVVSDRMKQVSQKHAAICTLDYPSVYEIVEETI